MIMKFFLWVLHVYCLVIKLKFVLPCLWYQKTCRIHVDYAAARDDQYEFECKQRELERLVAFFIR